MNREKRSSNDGMGTQGQGVGGRQEDSDPTTGGGGYLDEYPKSGFPIGIQTEDLRFADLQQINLPDHWILVAQEIGVEAFLTMWRMLDQIAPTDAERRVRVPRFSIFNRYQRDQWIRNLASTGLDPDSIRKKLAADCNESLCTAHIKRIIKK